MKQSVQLSDSVHIMLYLAIKHNPDQLTSEAIAQSVNTNPSAVRKIMSNLKKAGLISSHRGKADPVIIRPLEDITLLDIFHSLPGTNDLLQPDRHTSRSCPVGANIQTVLNEKYHQIQLVIEDQMSRITLKELTDEINGLIGEGAGS